MQGSAFYVYQETVAHLNPNNICTSGTVRLLVGLSWRRRHHRLVLTDRRNAAQYESGKASKEHLKRNKKRRERGAAHGGGIGGNQSKYFIRVRASLSNTAGYHPENV